MSEFPSPREIFEHLIHGVSNRRWEAVLDLYAEDAVVTHPFAPTAESARLEGQAG